MEKAWRCGRHWEPLGYGEKWCIWGDRAYNTSLWGRLCVVFSVEVCCTHKKNIYIFTGLPNIPSNTTAIGFDYLSPHTYHLHLFEPLPSALGTGIVTISLNCAIFPMIRQTCDRPVLTSCRLFADLLHGHKQLIGAPKSLTFSPWIHSFRFDSVLWHLVCPCVNLAVQPLAVVWAAAEWALGSQLKKRKWTNRWAVKTRRSFIDRQQFPTKVLLLTGIKAQRKKVGVGSSFFLLFYLFIVMSHCVSVRVNHTEALNPSLFWIDLQNKFSEQYLRTRCTQYITLLLPYTLLSCSHVLCVPIPSLSSVSIASSLVGEDAKTKFLSKMGQLTTSGAMLANVFQRKKWSSYRRPTAPIPWASALFGTAQVATIGGEHLNTL